jgi:hypothetical protein
MAIKAVSIAQGCRAHRPSEIEIMSIKLHRVIDFRPVSTYCESPSSVNGLLKEDDPNVEGL